MELDKIYNRDCLSGMRELPAESIDMILCDLPYGTTANFWDTVLPFDQLWAEYERLIKPLGAIVLTGNQRFSFSLFDSNPPLFRYKWIWVKNNVTNFINAKHRPMSKFEEVLVFSKGTTANRKGSNPSAMHYYPQGLMPLNRTQPGHQPTVANQVHPWNVPDQYVQEYTNYPNDVLRFNADTDAWHPTQKPVALFEYLIRTYTQPGELVLDNCMGSATTAIAAINAERHYLGYEINEDYYNKSLERIANHKGTQTTLW